jgi:hypothetical protein
MRCPRCADEQSVDALFCSRCGADLAGVTPTWQGASPNGPTALGPPSTRRPDLTASLTAPSVAPRPRRALPWVLGVLATLLVGVGAFVAADVLTGDDGAAQPSDGSESTVQAPATEAADNSVVTTVSPEPPAESGAAGPAVVALRAAADADMATVEALVGQWVPQVSQRRVGSRTGGLAMKAVEIAALHTALQQSVGAVLLNSSDYVFRADNMWVSIVPEGFATADAALDRCESLPVTDQPCVARFITHDESVSATVKQRKS